MNYLNINGSDAKAMGLATDNIIESSEAFKARRRTDAMLTSLTDVINAVCQEFCKLSGSPFVAKTEEEVAKGLAKAKERQKKANQKAKEIAEAEAEGRDLEAEGNANRLHKALKWAITEGVDLDAAIETARLEVETERAEETAKAEKLKAKAE